MEKFLNEFQEQVQHDGAESAMSDLKAMAAVALLPFQDAKVLIGEIMIVKAVTEYEESLKKGNQGTADAAASVLSKLKWHPVCCRSAGTCSTLCFGAKPEAS